MKVKILSEEKEHLSSLREWIDLEEDRIKIEEARLRTKITNLEKKSKGAYNQELDINRKLYNIVKKKYRKLQRFKR